MIVNNKGGIPLMSAILEVGEIYDSPRWMIF